MGRRRWTFRRFLKRRWRVAGFTLVLMAATLLVLAIQDRGHDPLWDAQPGDVAQLAVSPDATATYVVTQRVHENGTDVALHAFDVDGADRWQKPLNASDVPLLAAGHGWVATVTPFPGAKLLAWNEAGERLHVEFLEGTPRALAADGDRLAVALGGPGNRVLVYENWERTEDLRFPSPVNALDLRGERLVAGTDQGLLRVLHDAGTSLQDAEEVLNVSTGLSLRSVRLGDDGERVLAGGFVRQDGQLSGAVLLHDLRDAAATIPLWRHDLPYGVSLVEMDRAGTRALALEESVSHDQPVPRYRIHFLDAGTGDRVWMREVPGIVYRDGVGGRQGGVDLSADGRLVGFSTVDGQITLLDAADGSVRWTYGTEGATLLSFADEDGRAFVANARMHRRAPYDGVLGFDVDRETFTDDLTLFAPALLGGIFTVGFGGLAVAYRLDRRD